MFIKCKIVSSCAKAMTNSYPGGGGGGRIEVRAQFLFRRAQLFFFIISGSIKKKGFEGSILFHHCREEQKRTRNQLALNLLLKIILLLFSTIIKDLNGLCVPMCL